MHSPLPRRYISRNTGFQSQISILQLVSPNLARFWGYTWWGYNMVRSISFPKEGEIEGKNIKTLKFLQNSKKSLPHSTSFYKNIKKPMWGLTTTINTKIWNQPLKLFNVESVVERLSRTWARKNYFKNILHWRASKLSQLEIKQRIQPTTSKDIVSSWG